MYSHDLIAVIMYLEILGFVLDFVITNTCGKSPNVTLSALPAFDCSENPPETFHHKFRNIARLLTMISHILSKQTTSTHPLCRLYGVLRVVFQDD